MLTFYKERCDEALLLPGIWKESLNARNEPESDVAWDVPVSDWSADGLCRAAFRQHPHGARGAPGRRDEWRVSASAGGGVERGAARATHQGGRVLDGAVRGLRQLVGDDAGSG